MVSMRCLMCLSLLTGVVAMEATPISKVLDLMAGLKADVEQEGKNEAASYSEFAKYCKDFTTSKSANIVRTQGDIDTAAAAIEEKTAEGNVDASSLAERKATQELHSKDLDKTTSRCTELTAEYTASHADVAKAISSLSGALSSSREKGAAAEKAVSGDKPSAALIQGYDRKELQYTIAMAEAMGMIDAPKRKSVLGMLQAPEDMSGYSFHSDDIIKLLQSIHTQFTGQKTDLEAKYGTDIAACKKMKASIQGQISTNKDAMGALSKGIQRLAREVGEQRTDLVQCKQDMEDDQLYLKDLTARCEARANEWDKRTSMRSSEIAALTSAMQVLGGKVKTSALANPARAGAAAAANDNAEDEEEEEDEDEDSFLQQHVAPKTKDQLAGGLIPHGPTFHRTPSASKVAKKVEANVAAAQKVAKDAGIALPKPPAFVQIKSYLRLSTAARKDKALALLAEQGSSALSELANRAAADPLAKVKALIEGLVQRLLEESTSEASKKGFCDLELGKANKEKTFRSQEVSEINADIQTQSANIDRLGQENERIAKELEDAREELKDLTTDRVTQKTENAATVKTAQEGEAELREAVKTLKNFYEGVAKASLLQQPGPIIEDVKGAGFKGAYKGAQEGSKAIFALLETISSDFERTVRQTQASETLAARDFVKAERELKSGVAAKEMKVTLNAQDKKTAETKKETSGADLLKAQEMLDAALKEIETLRPTCIDTGMSYADKVSKREEEVAALKRAMCILDEEGVEKDCAK